MLHNDISKVYFTEEELKAKVKEIGKTLAEEYADKHPLVVGVLKGCFVFKVAEKIGL